jgi:hypothetical protein
MPSITLDYMNGATTPSPDWARAQARGAARALPTHRRPTPRELSAVAEHLHGLEEAAIDRFVDSEPELETLTAEDRVALKIMAQSRYSNKLLTDAPASPREQNGQLVAPQQAQAGDVPSCHQLLKRAGILTNRAYSENEINTLLDRAEFSLAECVAVMSDLKRRNLLLPH